MTGTKSGGKLKISVTSLSGHIKLTNLRPQIKNTKMQFEMLEGKNLEGDIHKGRDEKIRGNDI